MKKFFFITPEGLACKPSCDRPEPEPMDMQIIGFGDCRTMEDALKDLMELNTGVRNASVKPFCTRVENDNQRSLWLSERKIKTPLAS